jgi:hypothetical protein
MGYIQYRQLGATSLDVVAKQGIAKKEPCFCAIAGDGTGLAMIIGKEIR